MASCTNCGQFAMNGPQRANTTCPTCAAAAAAGNPVPKTATVTDHRDTHTLIPFEVPSGSFVAGGSRWNHSEKVPFISMVIMELRAVLVGDVGDVARLLTAATVRLVVDHRTVFERPLTLIATAGQGGDRDVEERLARLERMMNVLVEQESPAGEALRRLGGSKINFDSPTRLKRPELVEEHGGYEVGMTIDSAIQLMHPVTVRISVMGVCKAAIS